jgi:HNH endonuclease
MQQRLRNLVWARAARRCEYYRMRQDCDDITFEIDHIISESHGGLTRASNLALACFHCNSFKGANLAGIDRRTGQIVALFNPRRQNWSRHFRWRGPYLRGRTAVGRVTVAVLRINLRERVDHRLRLLEEGVFEE